MHFTHVTPSLREHALQTWTRIFKGELQSYERTARGGYGEMENVDLTSLRC